MLQDAKIWGSIIKFKFKNRNLRFYSSKRVLLDALKVLNEIFGMEVYKQLNVKGKIVVDIGSYRRFTNILHTKGGGASICLRTLSKLIFIAPKKH